MYTLHISLFRFFLLFVVGVSLSLSTPARGSAETDSDLFKKGVASFQRHRFSEAIVSFDNFLKTYPRTPLRDMTLYYLARAHLKSGQREQSAALTARLMREFPASYNRGTLDAELVNVLDSQAQKASPVRLKAAAVQPGKPAPPVKAATGVPLARPPAVSGNTKIHQATAATPKPAKLQPPTQPPIRQAAAKRHQPAPAAKPVAKQKAAVILTPLDQARNSTKTNTQDPAPGKIGPPRQVKQAPGSSPALADERMMAIEQYASVVGKGTAPFELELSAGWVTARAGSLVSIPFTISNRESSVLRLRLSSEFPPYFLPRFTAGNAGQVKDELSIQPHGTYRGTLTLAMPSAIDGSRFSYRIFAQSPTNASLTVAREAGIIASAAPPVPGIRD